MSIETKQRLLAATRQIINDQGIDALSMRNLGSCTTLSRSAVYRYFPDKESLLAEVAVENFNMIKQSFKQEIDSNVSFREMLKKIIKEFYSFGLSNSEHYKLMYATEWDKSKYPLLHESAFDLFKVCNSILVGALKEVNKPVDEAKEITALLFSFIHGLVQLHLVGHNEPEKGLNDIDKLINMQIDRIIYC